MVAATEGAGELAVEKNGTFASTAPGPTGSGGIRRPTAASMNARSSVVKNLKSVPTAAGGASAVPSCQGTDPLYMREGAPNAPSWIAAAAAVAVPAAAQPKKRERRATLDISWFIRTTAIGWRGLEAEPLPTARAMACDDLVGDGVEILPHELGLGGGI